MRSAFENHPDSLHTRNRLSLDLLKHYQRISLFALCSVVNVIVCLSDSLFFVESVLLVSNVDSSLKGLKVFTHDKTSLMLLT